MDVGAVADELYGLPLDEFTAARNAHVKQARQNGDRDAAASIQALGKPSAAAGLANQLVRQHHDELTPLLELGASLRAAMASLSGVELRTLGQQQHRLISTLVAHARSLAAAQGRTVSADQARGLEETLHAALADEDAAAQLLAGRLTETLQHSGLGAGGEAAAPLKSVPTSRSTRAASKSAAGSKAPAGSAGAGKCGGSKTSGSDVGPASAADRARERRAEAERTAQAKRAAEAKRAAAAGLEQAQAARDRAETDAADADERWNQAKAAVAKLREELERATAEVSKTDRVRHRLRAQADQARRAERAAQRRRDAAGP